MTQPARRVSVTINGKVFEVEVGDLYSNPITVLVNGRPYVVSLNAVESLPAAQAPTSQALESVARQTSVPERAPRPTGEAGPAVREVRAPMPGHIIDINVSPGDQVEFGQTLCALEAMKMKSAVRSPRDGAIAAVEVTEGQAVAHGDVLIRFA
jgi:glutaconyl-CoA/methylmalonyl-CoA decarboxylase subunit gamma